MKSAWNSGSPSCGRQFLYLSIFSSLLSTASGQVVLPCEDVPCGLPRLGPIASWITRTYVDFKTFPLQGSWYCKRSKHTFFAPAAFWLLSACRSRREGDSGGRRWGRRRGGRRGLRGGRRNRRRSIGGRRSGGSSGGGWKTKGHAGVSWSGWRTKGTQMGREWRRGFRRMGGPFRKSLFQERLAEENSHQSANPLIFSKKDTGQNFQIVMPWGHWFFFGFKFFNSITSHMTHIGFGSKLNPIKWRKKNVKQPDRFFSGKNLFHLHKQKITQGNWTN